MLRRCLRAEAAAAAKNGTSMGDLKSKPLIVVKGVLFLVIVLATALALFALNPDRLTALLIVLLIWSSARFYYFIFYVLEKYVDPTLGVRFSARTN